MLIPEDEIEKAKMHANRAEAAANRLVLVPVSKQRFLVVMLGNTERAGGKTVFRGHLVFGPTTREL